jgi:hypothetical protein
MSATIAALPRARQASVTIKVMAAAGKISKIVKKRLINVSPL